MRNLVLLLLVPLAPALAGCAPGRGPAEDGTVTLVFKHARHPGSEFFGEMIARFEEAHPRIRVREELLPAGSDDQHQFYVINLAAGADDFDVIDMDIVWVPEFARAGWLADLTGLVPPDERAPLNEAALAADWLDGRLYGVPWFVDVGVLYYRRDLLERYGFDPPGTLDELVTQARRILEGERDPRLTGFVWQGRQYEGLVVAALEIIRGHGGDFLGADGRSALETPEVLQALGFIDALVRSWGVSPPLVATLDEEGARLIFQSGRAVFMRNWPYAWAFAQQPGSPIANRVGLTVVPAVAGGMPAPVLGGYHVGVNARSPFVEEAALFVRHLIREDIQRGIATEMGRLPAYRALYADPAVRRALPYLADLEDSLDHARPRPVTPYYLMISQILQPELSAVVSGIRPPGPAMRLATQQIDRLLELR